jgi:hypothetical protein
LSLSKQQDVTALRTTILSSAEDFVRISESISELRRSAGVADDLHTEPDYVLACADRVRRACAVACWQGEKLAGVVFAFHHHVLGRLPSGYFVAGDYSGRGAMIARPECAAVVLSAAAERLRRERMHSLLLRISPALPEPPRMQAARSMVFHEIIPGDRLKLASSYADFLAGLGKHTRRNIRYYARRAAAAGIRFDPDVLEAEFTLAVRHLSASAEFPIAERRLARDLRLMHTYCGDRFALRDSAGAIVAVLSGFSFNGRFYLLSQVNDARLAPFSLSLVLRGFTIAHLIARGVRELQFMGGTSLALGRFCDRLNYSSYFVDRPHLVFSPLKTLAAALVDLLGFAGFRVPIEVEAFCGAYLSPRRLAVRTPLLPAALVKQEDRLRREKHAGGTSAPVTPEPRLAANVGKRRILPFF